MTLEQFYLGITTALGLLIGSFLNVVIHRLPEGKSIVHPRSSCPRCRKPVAWFDNLTILSWLLLKGRCRHCKKSISVRYPVVEALTACLFLAAFHRGEWGPLLWIRDWPFLATLIAVSFIDLQHRIIPDELSWGGLAFGLLTSVLDPELGWQGALIGSSVGFVFFYALAAGYERWSGKMGLGGGDIKLLAMLGAFLGWRGVFATVLLSSIVGSVAGIGWALASRKKEVMGLAIPYGPFLVLGALCYFLFGGQPWFQFILPI